jgi:dihydropteroate synthase
MFDKYLYALGRGVRGAKRALDDAGRLPDPAEQARDVTPAGTSAPGESAPVAALPDGGAPILPRKPLVLGLRPLVMGIVNVTPDSFSDGGDFLAADRAIEHGMRLVAEGADILDIGGESTRPGHAPVSAEEEIARVVPVIRALAARTDLPISIDTMKADVARAAIEAGASIINDVWGFQHDPALAQVAAAADVPVVVMHNREVDDPSVDMMAEVLAFLRRSIEIALAAGVKRERIIVDPGFGFGKTHPQSLMLVRDLARLREELNCPVLLGVSRKRAIGRATGRDVPRERVIGSVATAVVGAMNGAAIVRVHDVAPHVDAMNMFAAIADPARVEAI